MPTNGTRSVQIYGTPTGLTIREQRAFKQAERTIARGLKSFLEVGLALKEIRDQRLYRQQYRTFEEYVEERWDFRRQRAYQLLAASEVVSSLSTTVDIRLLPENEAQARPLTRLKAPKHRKMAWLMALKSAQAGGRPVTASDVEAAVLKLDGEERSSPVGGVPGFDRPRAEIQAVQITPSNGEHKEDNEALLGIRKSLTTLEEAIREAIEHYPAKKQAIRGFIAKARCDLTNWDKQIAAGTWPPIHFISLGGGVQSSTMFLMACKGELLPKPACAIFADTGDEPKAVYAWIKSVLKPASEAAGIPIIMARHNSGVSLGEEALKVRHSKNGPYYTAPSIPFFLLGESEKLGGPPSKGLGSRQCTQHFKIEVIHRAIKKFLGIPRAYNGLVIHQWMGISMDEVVRRKDAKKPWLHNEYPLMDQVQFTRQDCLAWLKRNGFPEAPRSACLYCPFKGNKEWLHLKTTSPKEFAKAVAWERKFQEVAAIPGMNMKVTPFLHRSYLPLDEVEFKKADNGGFNDECEGHCGV